MQVRVHLVAQLPGLDDAGGVRKRGDGPCYVAVEERDKQRHKHDGQQKSKYKYIDEGRDGFNKRQVFKLRNECYIAAFEPCLLPNSIVAASAGIARGRV